MFYSLPAVIYGAGNRAEHEKARAQGAGLRPVCFADADTGKQGGQLLGLPVLSLNQAKEQYGDFFVHITPWETREEIYNYLLDNNIPEDRIFNYAKAESCPGCAELDTGFSVSGTGIFTCCRQNATMKDETRVRWQDHGRDMEATISAYLQAKENLASAIKDGVPCRCTGCSRIKSEPRPVKKSIAQLALGIEERCQLNCIYCCYGDEASPLYKKETERRFVADFDYKRFIDILERRGLLRHDALISLTGGEITISPNMDNILNAVEGYRLYVYTNGLIYNERIARLAARPGGMMNISVDAGTRETYRQVKGADVYDTVWANIKRYSAEGAVVNLKYVLLESNSGEDEARGFIAAAVNAGVRGVVQVSRNFYETEHITEPQARHTANILRLAEQSGFNWYLVQTFTPQEETEILRLKEGI